MCVRERRREQRWLKCDADTDREKARAGISSELVNAKETKTTAPKTRDRVLEMVEEDKRGT